jgi:periplasmic protein TonB
MQPEIKSTEPESVSSQTLLDRCLVDGDAAATASGRRLRRKALGISFAVETVALALLIIAPLWTSIAQPTFSNPTFLPFFPGATHSPDVTSRQPISTQRPGVRHEALIPFTVGHVPQRPAQTTEDAGNNSRSIAGWDAMPSGVGAPIFSGIAIENPPQPPPGTIRKSEEKRRVKIVEGGVEQAQLISRIEPRYPPLALQIKKEGTVILHAIISRDGSITALDVISGHPLLVKAALDAVRQWRYRPTLLNGEPVEVETTITVIFRLQP